MDNGNIVAYGKSSSSAQGDITDVNNGGDDVLVATFTPDGEKISTRLYGGDQNDVLLAAHPLQNGSFIGVGYTSSSMSGDITATSNGGQDGLVMKFDSNGDVV